MIVLLDVTGSIADCKGWWGESDVHSLPHGYQPSLITDTREGRQLFLKHLQLYKSSAYLRHNVSEGNKRAIHIVVEIR